MVDRIVREATGHRELVVNPDLGRLHDARRFVQSLGQELGFSESRLFDLGVAVSEAVANAIEHAEPRGDVTVKTWAYSDRLEVHVRAPGEFSWKPGRGLRFGLGLPLMVTLSDRLAVHSSAPHTTDVVLTFYRPDTASGGEAAGQSPLDLFTELELFDQVLNQAPYGFVLMDSEGRFVYMNHVVAERVGSSRAELVGKPGWEWFPEPDPDVRRILQEAVATGEPVATVSYYPPLDLWLDYRGFPVSGGFALFVQDVSQQKQAEVELSRTQETLRETQELYRLLHDNLPQGVVFMSSDGTVISLNPAAEGLLGASGDELYGQNAADIQVDKPTLRDDGSPFPFPEHPAFAALRTGEPVRDVVMGVYDTKIERYRWLSANAVPLLNAGQATPHSVFSLFEDITERRRIEREKAELLARLDESSRLAAALNDINATITSSLSFADIMETVLREATKALAAEAALLELEGGGDGHAVRHTYGTRRALGRPLAGVAAPICAMATRLGQPLAVSDVEIGQFFEAEPMRSAGLRSFIAVAIRAGGEPAGVLIVYNSSRAAEFSQAQIDFTRKLGISISLALQNAELYARQKGVADTLQEALLYLPPSLPHLEIDSLYRSADDVALVGGDFYDVFLITDWLACLVIGDVCGHGVEAARTASLVRDTLRAYALRNLSLAEVLTATNEALVRQHIPSAFTTAFVVYLNTVTGSLEFASAGHPPAILRRGSGQVERLERFGPPLASFTGTRYLARVTKMNHDDVLLLYTDGVLEARKEEVFFGEERLAELVRGHVEGPQGLCRKLLEAVTAFCEGQILDDIALLAACRAPAHQHA